jgi:hypothetical protein
LDRVGKAAEPLAETYKGNLTRSDRIGAMSAAALAHLGP